MAGDDELAALTAGFDPMALLDALPDPVVVVGTDARLVWSNRSASASLGWDRSEWLGRDLSSLVHPDDLSTALLALESVQAKAVGELLELRVRDASGTYRHVELRGRVAVDLPGLHGVVLSIRDLTDRRRWELAGGDHVALAAVLDALPTIALVLTPDGRVRSTNRAFTRLLGHPLEEVVGRPLTDFVTIASTLVVSDHLLVVADGTGRVSFEVEMLRADGTARPVSLTLVDLADDGAVGGIVATATDITELVAARERLRHAATHDDLTGLPNRTEVVRRLDACLARGELHPIGVLHVSVGRMKEVNDAHGHRVGDAVLVESAERLGSAVRDADLVGRLRGVELVVVATGAGGDDVERLVDRIRWVMRPDVEVEGPRGPLGVRVAVEVGTAIARPGETAESVLGRADADLRAGKRARRGR